MAVWLIDLLERVFRKVYLTGYLFNWGFIDGQQHNYGNLEAGALIVTFTSNVVVNFAKCTSKLWTYGFC